MNITMNMMNMNIAVVIHCDCASSRFIFILVRHPTVAEGGGWVDIYVSMRRVFEDARANPKVISILGDMEIWTTFWTEVLWGRHVMRTLWKNSLSIITTDFMSNELFAFY